MGDIDIDAEAPDEASLREICARVLFDVILGEGAGIALAGASKLSIGEEESRRVAVAPRLRGVDLRHFRDLHVTRQGGGFTMRCVAGGEGISGEGIRRESGIKAATRHQFPVRQSAGGLWEARVIFDICRHPEAGTTEWRKIGEFFHEIPPRGRMLVPGLVDAGDRLL
jgi:hypothetical protein